MKSGVPITTTNRAEVYPIWNSSQNEYLLMFQDCRNYPGLPYTCGYGSKNMSDLYAWRLNGSADFMGEIPIKVSIKGAEWPAGVWSPQLGRYMLAWQELKEDFVAAGCADAVECNLWKGYDMRGMLLTGDGQPAGDDFRVSDTLANEKDDHQWHPGVAYNPTTQSMAVGWHDERTRTVFWHLSPYSVPDPTTYKDIMFNAIGAGGRLLSSDRALALDPGNTTKQYTGNAKRLQQYTRIAYDPTRNRYLAVWEDDRDGGGDNDRTRPYAQRYEILDEDIYGVFIDASTYQVGANFKISNAAGDDRNERFAEVVYNQVYDEFMVVWQRLDGVLPDDDVNVISADHAWRAVVGQRIAGDGSFIGGNFDIQTNAAFQQTYTSDIPKPSIACNTRIGTYVVTWTEQYSGSSTRYGKYAMVVLNGAGVQVGPVGAIATGSTETRIVYNHTGDEFVVAWHGGSPSQISWARMTYASPHW